MLKALKQTTFYKWYKRRREWRKLRRWSRKDEVARSFYDQFIRANDLCFDVVANMGTRVKVFRKLGARVVAVEPQPFCLSFLEKEYGRDEEVYLVESALGAEEGEAELHLSDAHTLSSMSEEWLKAVKASNRFGKARLQETITVPVTTLDMLVEQHGEPSFVKIDVEGYEREVLAGLSRALPCLSVEFTPECSQRTIDCIDRMADLGDYRFNYGLGEPSSLALSTWLDLGEIKQELAKFEGNLQTFGDIYGRLRGT